MLQQQFFLKKDEKRKMEDQLKCSLFSVLLYIIVILGDLSTFQQYYFKYL